MKKVVSTLFVWVFCSGLLQAGHFFLPPRTLYNFRPDLYLFGSPFACRLGPARFTTPAVYLPPYSAGFRPRVYQVILSSPVRMELVRANTADLVFHVHPAKALVYVDEKLIGNARDFASERERYPLVAGEHTLRIEYPGYRAFQTQMDIVPNRTLQLDIELEKIPSSSEHP